jgi:hypothetical protein
VVGGTTLPSAGRTFVRTTYGAQAGESRVLGSSLLNDIHVQLFEGSPITRFAPLQPSTQYVYPGVGTLGESRAATLFSHQIEASDTLTWSRGRHSLRSGMTAMYSRSGGDGQEFGGPFTLGQVTVKPGVTKPVADLSIEDIQSFTQGFGSTRYTFSEWIWSLFAQDDVKLRPDLTLDLGARYERQTFTDDTDNVAPRLGVTYRPAGDARTVLRGGYGVYYSEVRSDAGAAWTLNGPTGFFSFTAAPGQLGFPAALGPLPAFPPGVALPPRTITIRPGMASYYRQFFDVSKLKGYPDALLNPWTQSGTAGIEHEIGAKWFASADYVTQRTSGIDRPLDLNAPAPFARTAPGQVRTAAAADATRPIVPVSNGYRQVFGYVNRGMANYDGLQCNLRTSHEQYEVRIGYTWSKATNTVEPDVPAQAPNDANETGEVERGPSLLDQRHRLVASGWTRVPGQLVVGGVVTAASGYRYNVTTGFDDNGDGSLSDRPAVAPPPETSAGGSGAGSISSPGGRGVVIGRNAGAGRAIYDTDVFVQRLFRVGGARQVRTRQVMIRVELFNVFNHANIAGYNSIYGNSMTGVAAATLGMPLGGIANVFPGRQMQAVIRLQF